MEKFHKILEDKIDLLVHRIFKTTKTFPRDEIYGITSQLRRSTLSIMLNYLEGYGRRKHLVIINFLEISYGSLRETKYLIKISFDEGYIEDKEYEEIRKLVNEVGAMLWKTIEHMQSKSSQF